MPASRTRKILESVQRNGTVKPRKKRGGPPETWFKPGNPWAIKKGETRNPGGRPKLLSEAYKAALAATDDKGITNAAKVAMVVVEEALENRRLDAAKELRQGTEGERLTIDVSKLTEEQLERLARGEDLHSVTAAGSGGAGAEAQAESEAGASPAPGLPVQGG